MSMTKLLSLLFRRAAATAQISAEPAPTAEQERLLGCGWFDSSHDLHHGLQVREHASPDTLGQELPLAAWLELQLSGCRVTHAT